MVSFMSYRRNLLMLVGVLTLVASALLVATQRADAAADASATPVVYIVTGENFPDALGVGPASALARGPILMVTRDAIPGPTSRELSRLKPDRIVVVGGLSVIGSSVETGLKKWAPVSRIAGANRYETAALVSQAAFPAPPVGTGPTAAAAGDRYATGANPIILSDSAMTELGALTITIPSNGGVLNVITSVMLEKPDLTSGSFVDVGVRLDSPCTSTSPGLALSAADLTSSWYDSVPLNASVSAGAGVHTIRLCAAAFHVDATETTLVDAARISAVWTPSAMGNSVLPYSPSSYDRTPDFKAKIDRIRSGG